MKDAHMLAEVIEIRDGVKIVCIMSKADVSDTIDHLTVGRGLRFEIRPIRLSDTCQNVSGQVK